MKSIFRNLKNFYLKFYQGLFKVVKIGFFLLILVGLVLSTFNHPITTYSQDSQSDESEQLADYGGQQTSAVNNLITFLINLATALLFLVNNIMIVLVYFVASIFLFFLRLNPASIADSKIVIELWQIFFGITALAILASYLIVGVSKILGLSKVKISRFMISSMIILATLNITIFLAASIINITHGITEVMIFSYSTVSSDIASSGGGDSINLDDDSKIARILIGDYINQIGQTNKLRCKSKDLDTGGCDILYNSDNELEVINTTDESGEGYVDIDNEILSQTIGPGTITLVKEILVFIVLASALYAIGAFLLMGIKKFFMLSISIPTSVFALLGLLPLPGVKTLGQWWIDTFVTYNKVYPLAVLVLIVSGVIVNGLGASIDQISDSLDDSGIITSTNSSSGEGNNFVDGLIGTALLATPAIGASVITATGASWAGRRSHIDFDSLTRAGSNLRSLGRGNYPRVTTSEYKPAGGLTSVQEKLGNFYQSVSMNPQTATGAANFVGRSLGSTFDVSSIGNVLSKAGNKLPGLMRNVKADSLNVSDLNLNSSNLNNSRALGNKLGSLPIDNTNNTRTNNVSKSPINTFIGNNLENQPRETSSQKITENSNIPNLNSFDISSLSDNENLSPIEPDSQELRANTLSQSENNLPNIDLASSLDVNNQYNLNPTNQNLNVDDSNNFNVSVNPTPTENIQLTESQGSESEKISHENSSENLNNQHPTHNPSTVEPFRGNYNNTSNQNLGQQTNNLNQIAMTPQPKTSETKSFAGTKGITSKFEEANVQVPHVNNQGDNPRTNLYSQLAQRNTQTTQNPRVKTPINNPQNLNNIDSNNQDFNESNAGNMNTPPRLSSFNNLDIT